MRFEVVFLVGNARQSFGICEKKLHAHKKVGRKKLDHLRKIEAVVHRQANILIKDGNEDVRSARIDARSKEHGDEKKEEAD